MWAAMHRNVYSYILLNLNQKSFFGFPFRNIHKTFIFLYVRFSISTSGIYVSIYKMTYVQ